MRSHTLDGVVAWSDTDASGRIHFTAPWRWVENAEHALYRELEPNGRIHNLPRRATSAAYELPLRAGDPFRVELDIDRLGSSSIGYAWRIVGPDGVAVTGAYTVVHVDDSGRPAPLPAALVAGLTAD